MRKTIAVGIAAGALVALAGIAPANAATARVQARYEAGRVSTRP